jgi:hypothetical protein
VEPLCINYIGSLSGTPPARTLLIANDADYCSASAALRGNLWEEFDSFWVREAHHFAWLKALIEHTGLNHLHPVEFKQTTARELLAQRWSLTIPDWLTDEMILTEKLLDTDLPAGTHASVDVAFLTPLFGELGASFPRQRAGLLAEKTSATATQTELFGSAVKKAAWENTLQRWVDVNEPAWSRGFCARLSTSPMALWRDLTIWRLLHGYPQAEQEFALDPAAATFVRGVPIETLKGMSLNPEGRALALDQIKPFFEGHIGALSRQKFEYLVNAVSGELKEEFVALESALARAHFKIEPADVASVARRFNQCADVGQAALASLNLFVRPPKPTPVDAASADAAAWTKWFHTEYLPYRWWQTQRGEADGEVEETIGKFSEWYCREFVHVHSDPALSAVQTLTQWRPSVLQDDVSLVLLVDNLPWAFWDSFERALASAGLHKHESHDCFAPLPSHTSVCKPALISGRWDATGSDYRKMLEARSTEEWGGRPVHYLAGVDQLSAMKPVTAPVVLLLNYLASDEALHADSAAAGTTHAEQLSMLYNNLSSAVGEFARRASEGGRKFGLYVITDHGATHVLDAEKQSIDAKLSQHLFADEKHRSATLSAAEAAQVPENLWELGHRFLNPFQPEGNVHFIPRGHSTVSAPSRRPIYCHGGASPEEVIIPCGVFRLFRAVWVEPNVRFVDLKLKEGKASFYVKRIANVMVEIQNANADECRLESVVITPAVGEIRDFSKSVVSAKSVGQTTVSLYFAPGAAAVPVLTFEFNFRLAQEMLVRHVELPVLISSAAAVGTDLTSLS